MDLPKYFDTYAYGFSEDALKLIFNIVTPLAKKED